MAMFIADANGKRYRDDAAHTAAHQAMRKRSFDCVKIISSSPACMPRACSLPSMRSDLDHSSSKLTRVSLSSPSMKRIDRSSPRKSRKQFQQVWLSFHASKYLQKIVLSHRADDHCRCESPGDFPGIDDLCSRGEPARPRPRSRRNTTLTDSRLILQTPDARRGRTHRHRRGNWKASAPN